MFFSLLLFLTTGLSHQQKEAYTVVKPNKNTGKTEVIHRFYLHDAEHGFTAVMGKNLVLNENKEIQRLFADYVIKSFQISDSNGSLITANTVGHEIEGRYIWVYQEIANKLPCQLQVKMTAFHEIWAEHINQVNFEWPNGVKAARLTLTEAQQQLQIYNCDSINLN